MLPMSPPPISAAAVQACGADCVTAVTAAEILRLADDLRAQGRIAAADALLRGLFDDPVADVRREARFRFAQSLIARQRYAEAIEQLDRILAESPSAAPVRLELAKALELSGNHGRSLREFARVQAGALPANLAREIDQVVSTLRSIRPFGGSIELGIAPDSNANGATGASSILINGLPFSLDRSARRKSGLGLEATGQLFWRRPLGGTTRLVVDAIAQGNIYRDADLDGGSVQIGVGPEFSNRMRPSLLVARRWYMGRGYSWSYGGNVQWLKPVSRRTIVDVGARVERIAVQRSSALDGVNYTGSIALEHALQPSLFVRVSVSVGRYQARSPVYATTSGETALLIAKDLGPVSLYARAGYALLASDAPFLGQKRHDDRIEWGGGLSVRRVRIFDASPVLRFTRIINYSSATLYDTSRTRVEIALSRPF